MFIEAIAAVFTYADYAIISAMLPSARVAADYFLPLMLLMLPSHAFDAPV